MSMISIKQQGLDKAMQYLVDASKASETVANSALRQTAESVKSYAEAYVPIDEYNLQKSIIVVGEPSDNAYTVTIDFGAKGTRAKTVEQYAFRMENGNYSAKAGWPRGPKFMERAAEAARRDLETTIIQSATNMLGRILSSAGSAISGTVSTIGSMVKSFAQSFGLWK